MFTLAYLKMNIHFSHYDVLMLKFTFKVLVWNRIGMYYQLFASIG